MNWGWLRSVFGTHRRAEMREGLADAERRLAEAQAQDPEIRKLVAQMRRFRERNGFAPMIRDALKGHW